MDKKLNNPVSNKLINTSDLLFIWKLITKSIAVLIFIPVLFYLIGYVYVYRLNNVFGARAQLLLKSNDTYDYQDQIYQGIGAYSSYTDIQNQIRILNSRDLIGEVVEKLKIEISYYVVGRIRKQEVFGTQPFECDVVVHNQNLYELPIKLTILDGQKYTIDYVLYGENKHFDAYFDKTLKTEDLSIVTTKKYIFDDQALQVIKASEYEVMVHSKNYLIGLYQSNLKVENQDFTSILDVTVKDGIESRAVVFMDTLCASYVDYSRRIQLEVNQNTLDNIQKQLDTIKQFIEMKEQDILNYKESKQVLDIDKEKDHYFVEYVKLGQQERILEEQKGSIDLLEHYLEDNADDRVLPPYFYVETSDNYLSESIGNLRGKQTKLALKKTQEHDESPNMINLQNEINMAKSDILDYLKNLRKAIDISLEALNNEMKKYEVQIQNLPKSAQDILNIQRELDVNNKMYLYLLEKKINTLITRAGIIPQVRIIEQTRSIGLIEPNKSKIRIMFLLAGIIIALVIATIRKLFFERIENVQELAGVTTMAIIGGVPHVKDVEDHQIVVSTQPKSQVTESFRTIRTNLNYLGNEHSGAKIIGVSSYFPGEGKTFVSVNTAALFAKSDKRILMIDFDLHKPRVHKAFNLPNEKGVSTFLSTSCSAKELVNIIDSNLHIITSGPIAPNPSELILKKRVAELIKEMQDSYDYIIVDTPPFGLLHDSIEMLRYFDVFVVILNTRMARKSGIRYIEETLQEYENVGKAFVLNGVKRKRLQYYYAKYTYKYGYSYNRYGYGYGGYGESYEDN